MPRNPLNPRRAPINKKTGRRKRTRRVFNGNGPRPRQTELMLARWQDPVFKEKMRCSFNRSRVYRAMYPMKYARTRIPDGLTRAKAKPLWDRAYELADKFIQILKDTGRL